MSVEWEEIPGKRGGICEEEALVEGRKVGMGKRNSSSCAESDMVRSCKGKRKQRRLVPDESTDALLLVSSG